MLDNPILTRCLAMLLGLFGCYLAVYNSQLSAIVINERSGLDIVASVAIAVGLTGIELWFASWARSLANLKKVWAAYRRKPAEIAFKLFVGGVGLALVYHYDIESTRLSAGLDATDRYFFVWSVAWLVFGPEIAISLCGWLWQHAMIAETRISANFAHQKAEHKYRKSKETKMVELAEQAGTVDGITQARARWGGDTHQG